jgi:hypothetical protein
MLGGYKIKKLPDFKKMAKFIHANMLIWEKRREV